MSEVTTAAPAAEATAVATTAEMPETATVEVDWQAEAEKWKTQSQKQEQRAKANADAAKELDRFKQAAMSETEKAVALARAEGRTEALRITAAKVVDAEVRAAAAGRSVDVEALLEGLDRSRFIDEEGEVDRVAIAKWIERVAPAADPSRPDLGQGARGAVPLNGDPIEKMLRSKLGIA